MEEVHEKESVSVQALLHSAAKAIGDLFDTRVDYMVRLFGPAIILFPKGRENLLSRLENLEKKCPRNTAVDRPSHTGSWIEE